MLVQCEQQLPQIFDEVDVDDFTLESTPLVLSPTELSPEDTTSILFHFNLIDSLLRGETRNTASYGYNNDDNNHKLMSSLIELSSPRDTFSFPRRDDQDHDDEHSLFGEGVVQYVEDEDEDEERLPEPSKIVEKVQILFELHRDKATFASLICRSDSCPSSITSCDRSSLDSDIYYFDSSCEEHHHHDSYFFEEVAIEEPDKWQEV